MDILIKVPTVILRHKSTVLKWLESHEDFLQNKTSSCFFFM